MVQPRSQTPAIADISSFKKQLSNIIAREMMQRPTAFKGSSAKNPDLDASGPGETMDTKKVVISPGIENGSRTVLTLFGGGGSSYHPKQLFSSLQEPAAKTSSASQTQKEDVAKSDVLEQSSIASLPPLRENALPNGITTTRIIPVHSAESRGEKQRVPTLGELFAPPPTLPPMNPPRQSRHTATRSSSVNWFNPAEASAPTRPSRRDSYTNQPLSTGQWLTYSVAPSPTQLSSPEAKRKQRDRALSIGESQSSVPQELVAAHQQAKEEALFRSAYSNFAPSKDDSAALVPEELKNRLWWAKFGHAKYLDSLGSLAPDTHSGLFRNSSDPPDAEIDEDQMFKEAVDAWTPAEIPLEFKATADTSNSKDNSDKDVDELLTEISELLETLNSYQRVRNLSLATNARTTAGQNPQLTAMSGSPTSPTSAEFDVYSILKTQLTLIVASLPPYAVAKLNGEQMAQLNISTRIQVESRDYKGTMEEDELATKARQAALNVATSSGVRIPNSTISMSGRGNSYQQPAVNPVQRGGYASHSGASRPSAPSASYPSQQYSSRLSTSNQYGATNSQQAYQSPRPPSAGSARPPYSTSQYGQSTPQTQASNGNRHYSTQNGYSYNQPAAPPAPMTGSQYQRPSQPGYQQRAQNSQNFSYGTLSAGRSASPQNLSTNYTAPTVRNSYNAQQFRQNQAQPSYSSYRPPSQSGPNGGPGSTPVQSTPGTIGEQLSLTVAEQAEVMLRQKQQLAEQMRQQNSTRQGSGTPQPNGQVNGQLGGQSNGTPTPQANGVTAGSG